MVRINNHILKILLNKVLYLIIFVRYILQLSSRNPEEKSHIFNIRFSEDGVDVMNSMTGDVQSRDPSLDL
jgi:predicted fused transcriptional regulator/phosphomethylpyrimidine kinase